MAKLDHAILAHLEWIGFVRPTGLVVSAPALVRAGAILDRRDAAGQRLLRACAEEREFDLDLEREPQRIREFYEVRAPRVEPVGLVYLWPETN